MILINWKPFLLEITMAVFLKINVIGDIILTIVESCFVNKVPLSGVSCVIRK